MRIGIIGTGRITQRFVPEARTVEGIQLSAVYNPRATSAKAFALEMEIPFATNKIEEFLEVVDAVYIASPHDSHAGYAKQMLQAGKHVLCEKPASIFGQGRLFYLTQFFPKKSEVI